MLIVTHRHTPEDLSAWDDWKQIDELSRWSKHKAARSIEVIQEWASMHQDIVVCTSWGKDSVVLLDLVIKSGIRAPVVFMRFDDRANPDCDLVRDQFLSAHKIDYHEETFEYAKVRKSGAHWKAIARKWGFHRITGIRNDESGKRELQWALHGFASEFSCRPLSLWKGEEVFAYIHHNDLPLSPVYGYLGGGRWRRDRLRTHSLAGSSGDGMGRTEWEKEYYGDVLNRLHAPARSA